ncbi:uncharacterized protein LOC123559533 [Mercenaria mercenaria]|uniref:uncharacterized protein LOC123559533 n=1 Tax=Mercenaria mercenaria TaxID=6596 RepID=UPI00234F5D33|nr:uncharacterized protein LOC123559533 [Mercenaria mercenaria]
MIVLHRTFGQKLVLVVFCFPILLMLLYIFRNSIYLLSNFVFTSENKNVSENCNYTDTFERIPPMIHQIHGFKDSKLEISHVNKMKTWANYHKNYTHYLWNETSANNLIKREYSYIYPIYKSYGSWIQRADVARYVILHHYGGWYIDLDVICNSGLHKLVENAYQLKKRVILHITFPVGTSNDIFGITPRHPYLRSVLGNLYNANRWYLIPHWNILFSAGSTYMWGRYLNFPCKEEFLILEKEQYKQYFQIEHDGSWHSWDDRAALLLLRLITNRVWFTTFMVLLIVMFSVFLRRVICPRK